MGSTEQERGGGLTSCKGRGFSGCWNPRRSYLLVPRVVFSQATHRGLVYLHTHGAAQPTDPFAISVDGTKPQMILLSF